MNPAPLPAGWHELRPLTFYEQTLDALRRRRKFRKPLPEYPGPPDFSLSHPHLGRY